MGAVIAERAFLLLKPDCLRLGHTAAVERAVAAEGLGIEGRRELTLSPADVRHLWAEYDERGNALTLAFLDRYLTTGPSELLLLRGPDAFEAARRIKRTIRSGYAEGPFANVIHAAERRDERDRQQRRLLGAGTEAGPPTVPPRPRGLDFGALFDVPALVDEVWPLIQGTPADPGPADLGGTPGPTAVRLGHDPGHTLDSTVTALWHAVPGIEPRRAVLLVLHAGWSGSTAIAVGDGTALRRCLRTLHEHGIRNCGTGPVSPA